MYFWIALKRREDSLGHRLRSLTCCSCCLQVEMTKSLINRLKGHLISRLLYLSTSVSSTEMLLWAFFRNTPQWLSIMAHWGTQSIRDHRAAAALNYSGINLLIPLTSAEALMVYMNINENRIWSLHSRSYTDLVCLLKMKCQKQ